MSKDLSEFVNLNCCNQFGCKSDIQTIVVSLEALVKEAYDEGYNDSAGINNVGIMEDEAEIAYQKSTVKRQLEELKQEVCE